MSDKSDFIESPVITEIVAVAIQPGDASTPTILRVEARTATVPVVLQVSANAARQLAERLRLRLRAIDSQST
jgi:hypothetical protein